MKNTPVSAASRTAVKLAKKHDPGSGRGPRRCGVGQTGGESRIPLGVRIAYGTDSGVYPHGRNAIQLGYMVRFGMTPLAAIRSATVVAAELMGWQDRVGSLAPGFYADLLAVPSDPLAAVDGSGLDALMAPALAARA